MRVLIAESEPDIRNLYSEYLSSLGIDVVVAEDSNKCLSAYNENQFDLIILDTHLRACDAAEVAEKIRDNMPNQRIGLTTTYSLDQITDIINLLQLSTEDILVKPFKFSSLQSALAKGE